MFPNDDDDDDDDDADQCKKVQQYEPLRKGASIGDCGDVGKIEWLPGHSVVSGPRHL